MNLIRFLILVHKNFKLIEGLLVLFLLDKSFDYDDLFLKILVHRSFVIKILYVITIL
jgi:hypothetical protein